MAGIYKGEPCRVRMRNGIVRAFGPREWCELWAKPTDRIEVIERAPTDTTAVGRPGQQQGDQHWPETT